jgi:hypothetical protein
MLPRRGSATPDRHAADKWVRRAAGPYHFHSCIHRAKMRIKAMNAALELLTHVHVPRAIPRSTAIRRGEPPVPTF